MLGGGGNQTKILPNKSRYKTPPAPKPSHGTRPKSIQPVPAWPQHAPALPQPQPPPLAPCWDVTEWGHSWWHAVPSPHNSFVCPKEYSQVRPSFRHPISTLPCCWGLSLHPCWLLHHSLGSPWCPPWCLSWHHRTPSETCCAHRCQRFWCLVACTPPARLQSDWPGSLKEFILLMTHWGCSPAHALCALPGVSEHPCQAPWHGKERTALESGTGLAQPRQGQTCWSSPRHKTATEGKGTVCSPGSWQTGYQMGLSYSGGKSG